MGAASLVLLAVAALLVGFANTAIGGMASVAVAIFAYVLPTRESTAAILLLLLVGDVVAEWHYRRDADLTILRRLLPAVLRVSCSERSSCRGPTTRCCAGRSA